MERIRRQVDLWIAANVAKLALNRPSCPKASPLAQA
jgi:hypothetical protein